ncbi:beta-1,6-N-acetylglucosaminyltransferase [Paenibacillus kandeliae]|uniref:beta-1,6-N-acetylglucosaminyltransferase n=1 Tax=Paenibacillus kandeliae TaxID=3231269 RepID=UPI00345A1EAF
MKIAYFIMAHHKPDQLQRLLQAIYSPQHLYVIHVDSKADAYLHDMVSFFAEHNDNIKLLTSRSVRWAAWSQVQLELDAIRELLHMDQDWDYYINLSGQDFPLVKQEQLEQLLEGNTNNYVRIEPIPPAEKNVRQNFYWVEDMEQIKRMGEREPFESYFESDITPVCGSSWKMITRSLAHFAVYSTFSYELQEYCRYCLAPDEMFFQLLLYNSDYVMTHSNMLHRFFEMEAMQEGAMSRPRILTQADFDKILQSDCVFARKFDDAVDSEILNLLEKHLGLPAASS